MKVYNILNILIVIISFHYEMFLTNELHFKTTVLRCC